MPKFSTIIETIIISILFVGAIVVPFIAIIGKNMMSKSSSSSLPSLSLQQQQQQRSIEIVYFTVGVFAIVGLAFYLYNKNNNNKQNDDKNDKSTTTAVNHKNKSTKSTTTTTTTTNQQIKDIWKAGNNNNSQQNSNSNNNNNRTTNTKNRKGAYKEKPFGSKYYYAHNDSNTTGGYKDGLKMEDYRMNGPRLLSRNGLSVQDETTTTTTTTTDDDDDDDDDNDKEIPNNNNNNNADGNDDDVQDNNTAVAKNITNITKYLWDDPGDSKGIGTIRIDVLPSSSSSSPSFVDVKDVKIENVNASLMDGGRGLLANIIVVTDTGGSCRYYQLKINKLYENASDVKVIIKPKRLLIKIYKKKTKNYNDLVAWPQPHKKI